MCGQCTSYWYYVIGTSPRSARSKLRFLSFCDQNPWKDVKSLIVFLEFVYIICIIRVTGTLMKTIIRSLSIKCNFTRMRVFKMEDEAFAIHIQV